MPKLNSTSGTQRIALPMIGGMVSLTLAHPVILPAIYAVVKGLAIRAPRAAPVFRQPGPEAREVVS
jgi:Cu(I)/Ag(I) efflux system membrane protein CusA/SilA